MKVRRGCNGETTISHQTSTDSNIGTNTTNVNSIHPLLRMHTQHAMSSRARRPQTPGGTRTKAKYGSRMSRLEDCSNTRRYLPPAAPQIVRELRVAVVGAPGVGKKALTARLLDSRRELESIPLRKEVTGVLPPEVWRSCSMLTDDTSCRVALQIRVHCVGIELARDNDAASAVAAAHVVLLCFDATNLESTLCRLEALTRVVMAVNLSRRPLRRRWHKQFTLVACQGDKLKATSLWWSWKRSGGRGSDLHVDKLARQCSAVASRHLRTIHDLILQLTKTSRRRWCATSPSCAMQDGALVSPRSIVLCVNTQLALTSASTGSGVFETWMEAVQRWTDEFGVQHLHHVLPSECSSNNIYPLGFSTKMLSLASPASTLSSRAQRARGDSGLTAQRSRAKSLRPIDNFMSASGDLQTSSRNSISCAKQCCVSGCAVL